MKRQLMAAAAVAVAVGLAASPLAVLAAGPSSSPGQDGSPGAGRPIQHVVFLMQENHTFDNYFSEFPGVEKPPASVCEPNWIPTPQPSPTPTRTPGVTATPKPSPKNSPTPSPTPTPAPSATACYERFHLSSHRTVDLNHSAEAAVRAYNSGRMDGFSAAQVAYNLPEQLTVGYYDGTDLPLYYNLAHDYVLAQRFFSSAWGSSEINHMYSIAARGPGPMPTNGFEFQTIFDRLQAAGVSWKFYVQNYDPKITFRDNDPMAKKASQLIWAPMLNFGRFVDDPSLNSHIVDLQQYYTDLQNGTLPAVAYLAPSGLSEHPPGDITIGQSFGATTITSLMRSSAWDSSLFVLTWDDWGGWYDHVPPPQIDADGYGFRVPALIVSPYARHGLIDNTTYDFTSVLKFIEDNWGLPPLTGRDATANSVANALDFSRPPSPPTFPAQTWQAPATLDTSSRPLLLAIYAVVFAIAIVCGFLLLRPRSAEVPERA